MAAALRILQRMKRYETLCLKRFKFRRSQSKHHWKTDKKCVYATSTAKATTTPQNNGFNEEKQSPCTCVLNFGTFLCVLEKQHREITEITKFKVL